MLAAAEQLSRSTARMADDAWLRAYLKTYYYLPPLGFWRAIEARELGSENLVSPSLDVGGYDGSFAATWLGDRPPFDVALDIHPVESHYTRRAYRRVVTGDAQRMPFDTGSFNGILCNSVIEHVPDDTKVVGELGRVLRPGGILLLTTPSVFFHDFLPPVRRARQRGDAGAADSYIKFVDQRLGHYHYRPIEEWRELLGAAGLSVESHSYYLPEGATACWDRLDNWLAGWQFGRPRSQWIVSPKLSRLLRPGFWEWFSFRFFWSEYRRALKRQRDPGARGASLYIRAIRE
jgi:SAM-dependent methyltransferase